MIFPSFFFSGHLDAPMPGLHARAGGGHFTHAGEGCEALAGAARILETKAMGMAMMLRGQEMNI